MNLLFIDVRPSFYLAGNPFSCDCELEWLAQINDISLNGNHGRVIDLDEVTCEKDQRPLTSMASKEFLCEYRTHCFPNCLCCDFYACDCRMQCPKGCTCSHDAAWGVNVIECSAWRRQDVPLLIPMDATQIRLDGNDFGRVDTQSFIGRRRVTQLYLNASRVTAVSAQTLSGLASLEVLHLEDNIIAEILGNEFLSLSSLRELYLQNNNLARIGANAFDGLTSLTTLRLDGNVLTNFPVWQLVVNPSLFQMALSENLWSCECDFLLPFKAFLRDHSDKISDASNVTSCVTADLEERVLDMSVVDRNLTACLLRNEGDEKDVSSKLQSTSIERLVPFIVAGVLAFVVTIAICAVVCIFKEKIKNWLYNKSGEIYDSRNGGNNNINAGSSVHSGSCYANGDGQKLFDVYISYSTKDAEFVDESLAPTLEKGATSYKLCLHQRDFPPTASLYDTVSVATESSSRIILVLTKAYLECASRGFAKLRRDGGRKTRPPHSRRARR